MILDQTLSWPATHRLTPSQLFFVWSPPDGGPSSLGESAIVNSLVFSQPTTMFQRSDVFTPSATSTPLRSLAAGESYSLLVIETQTESLSAIVSSTVVWSELCIEWETRTRVRTVISTIIFSAVAVRTHVKWFVRVLGPKLCHTTELDRGSNTMDPSRVIGVAGGGSAVAALLIGMMVFIVRHRHSPTDGNNVPVDHSHSSRRTVTTDQDSVNAELSESMSVSSLDEQLN
jgi:hypothetical protein